MQSIFLLLIFLEYNENFVAFGYISNTRPCTKLLSNQLPATTKKNYLKSIHYKRRAFSIFTTQKSNTFVEKIQNIIGMAGV